MKKVCVAACAVVLSAVAMPFASAHVTVQPNEAQADSFSRFVVRVPNERDDAATVKVKVELPPLAFVSFEDKAGWKREVATGEFDEPIEAFGQEITEGVLSVTWSGGAIQAGEFAEFGFSAKMPAEEGDLEFKATQTYDSGEVVEWTGAEDSETPAARVATYDLGGVEGGYLAALDALSDDSQGPADQPAASADEGDEEARDVGTILGSLGLGFGLLALVVALANRRTRQ